MRCSLPAIGLPRLPDPWIKSPVNQYGSILSFHLFLFYFGVLDFLWVEFFTSLKLKNGYLD